MYLCPFSRKTGDESKIASSDRKTILGSKYFVGTLLHENVIFHIFLSVRTTEDLFISCKTSDVTSKKCLSYVTVFSLVNFEVQF